MVVQLMPLVLWFSTTFPDTRDSKADEVMTDSISLVLSKCTSAMYQILAVNRENNIIFEP
jgi:hypothetical protein